MIASVARLNINLNLAIYTGGILGFLNCVIRKPITEIESRLNLYLFKQYKILQEKYDQQFKKKEELLNELLKKKTTDSQIELIMGEYFNVNKNDKDIAIPAKIWKFEIFKIKNYKKKTKKISK